jgi:hypothetical protein
MSRIIVAKIDVMKIDKAKLFPGKNGAKYLDVVLRENKDGEDQYGNHFMVCQSVSKEEREAGTRGAILGNGRYVEGAPKKEAVKPRQKAVAEEAPAVGEDDVPF